MKKVLLSVLAIFAIICNTFSQSTKMHIKFSNGGIREVPVNSIEKIIWATDDTDSEEVEAIDLGLSVKWANMNVGATKIEDFGNLYAWGELEPKEEYSAETYFDPKGWIYNPDLRTELEDKDDVARVNWGEKWRMPTMKEIEELVNNCTWKWVVIHNVEGHFVTGPNGNSIFLPAAGSSVGPGPYGNYWTKTLFKTDKHQAYFLYYYLDDIGPNNYYRYSGKSVRPVWAE